MSASHGSEPVAERVGRALRDPDSDALTRLAHELRESGAPAFAAKALDGELARRRGDHVTAGKLLREAIEAEPSLHPAYHCAALAFVRTADAAHARDLWSALLARDPEDPIARYQIALTWHDAREFAQAETWYREHLARHPQALAAWYNLGLVQAETGRPTEAAEAFARAVAIDPSHVRAWTALGTTRRQLGDDAGAADAFTRASTCDPSSSKLLELAASALSGAAELPAAIAFLDRAIALDPGKASLRWRRASDLSSLGLHEAALDELERALTLDPSDYRGHSALLLELQYDASLATREESARAHREWVRRHCAGLPALAPALRRGTQRSARINIGYLSPRFGHGPLANFFLPVLLAHDRKRFHVTLYSAHEHRDPIAARMRAACDRWRDLPDDDVQAAQAIAADDIDVLVDLAGHTPGHRLPVLARRPARVQATWLDYFETTGMRAIDCMLSDAIHTPGEEAAHFAERLVLLPGCRFVYAPVVAPVRSPPPSLKNGVVTFGSFNRHAKITDATLALWKAVLDQMPTSRLQLRASAYRGRGTIEWLQQHWAERGLPVERIDFRPYVPIEQAIAAYAELDVALDTSPFNGGVTTCDALSMGVPVVALHGDRMIARQSAALLTAAGCSQWIAASPSDYVRTAIELARSPNLAAIRDELFETFPQTALCDVPRFVATLERTYERLAEIGPHDGDVALPPIDVSAIAA
jgi:predicted O-linked N-acetylglucosamine transferase (SPINDLY family)